MWKNLLATVCFALCASVLPCVAQAEQASKMLTLDPGRKFFDQGDYKRAAEEFSKAISKDPADTIAYYNRGLAYYRLGQ